MTRIIGIVPIRQIISRYLIFQTEYTGYTDFIIFRPELLEF